MIQRIQTVFLFNAFILTGLVFFMPFASLISNEVYKISFLGITSVKAIENIQQPLILTIVGSIVTTLIFVVIFLYKNRKFQMNLTIISILLLIGLNIYMYFILSKYQTELAAEIKYNISFIFPVISAILLILAYRGINKDEKLVRSLDRLR